jgi:Tol biopolymer transport system component
MELLEGKALSGPLSYRTALTSAIEICDALFEAHRLGITHRDLKPANIMVTRNGIVLLDFGLAKMDGVLAASAAADDKTIIESTQPGQIVGTLHYMSPEQLQGKPTDPRSDIFSFGLVLYEMLTGKRAITAEDPASIISQIILGSAPQLDAPSLEAPEALGRVVQRCLEKKPEERWQSTRDIQWVLQEVLEALERAPAAGPVQGAAKPTWRIPNAALAALTVLTLLLMAGIWWRLKTRLPDVSEWRVRPLTAYSGLESMPALSPDGKLVAFVWNGDAGDNFDIYVKPIGDETLPLRITTDAAPDSSPAWSPDGDKLAFLRRTGGEVRLMIGSSHGGGERVIAAVPESSVMDRNSTTSWSPDGRFLAMAAGPILRVNIESREVKPLTSKLPPSQYDSMPQYAPDGSALAFVRGPYPSSRRLYLQRLDREGNPSGDAVPLTEVSQGLVGIAWWPERKSLITAIGYPDSMMEAVRVPLSGKPFQFFPLDATAVSYPSYDPAHRRLVYQRRWRDLNIVRGSLRAPKDLPQLVVGSTFMDMSPDVSPDGDRIVFVSTRTGQMGLWRADRNGANQILLATLGDETMGSPHWMPDSKLILFDGGQAGSSALYTVSSEGGVPAKMPGNGQFAKPSISPDGKWIYYTNSSTGRRELYKMPFGGGPQTQLTREGGTDALTSADGSIVFFWRDDEIRRIAAAGGPESTITTGVKRGKWTICGDKVYAIRARDGRSVIVEMGADGRGEGVVYEVPFQLLEGWTVQSISVSARTGEIFLQQQTRLESDLMLVENFR